MCVLVLKRKSIDDYGSVSFDSVAVVVSFIWAKRNVHVVDRAGRELLTGNSRGPAKRLTCNTPTLVGWIR
jgi:hypothetical protein